MWNCIPCLLTMSSKGTMYIVNIIGPGTDPWGTPHTNDVGFDWVRAIDQSTLWSARQHDLNQFKSVPQISSPDLGLSWSTSWSTVSNAALKSSIISNTLLLLSTVLTMSSCIHASAVSVLWNVLYEDCNSSYKSLVVTYDRAAQKQ